MQRRTAIADVFVDGYGGFVDQTGRRLRRARLRHAATMKRTGPAGRFASVSHGAIKTFHYQFTVEAAPTMGRLWLPNGLTVPITGVKAAFACANKLGADNSTDSIDPTQAGGTWSNVPFTQAVTVIFNAALSAATSGTLASAWAGTTGTYPLTFSDGSIRYATLTNSSTSATWSGAVSGSPYASTVITTTGGSTLQPGATIDNVAWTPTDWQVLTAIDPVDGTNLWVVHVRVTIDSANANITAYNWTDMGGWETPANVGGRAWRTRAQSVDAIANKALFTDTTFASQVPPIMLEYTTREPVLGLSVPLIGDSIVEMTGASIRNYGGFYIARDRVSTPRTPIEICNLAINGASSSRWPQRAAILNQVRFPVVFCEAYTVNGAGGGLGSPTTPMTAADVVAMDYNYALTTTIADANDTRVVPIFGAPTNAVAKALGSSDALRQSINSRFAAAPVDVAPLYIDLASPVLGPEVINSQQSIDAACTRDQVHFNDEGQRRQASRIEDVYRRLLALQ